MVICPQCNIQHDPGEEFCRKCGKFLLVIEDDPSLENEEVGIKLICPKCKKIYKKGTYCRKCGSLMKRSSSPEIDLLPLEIKSIKRWARKCQRLIKEKKEIEICLSNLEERRDSLSREIYHSISNRYKSRLEDLLPLSQHIENEVKSLRKRITDEIDLLQRELLPLQKRLVEFKSLYKSGAILTSDFLREKREMKRGIKFRQKRLKDHQQILSLLPHQREGEFIFPKSTWNFYRPLTFLIASLCLALIGGGLYWVWPKHSKPDKPNTKEIVISSSLPPSSNHSPLSNSKEEQEFEKIKSVFENIRLANLQKNINLFMSCFSSDFKDLEGKRMDTLKTWENFSYLHLSYDLKKQTISGETAQVRLEWSIRTLKKVTGQLQDDRALMDVSLKKEDGRWKVKEINPAR